MLNPGPKCIWLVQNGKELPIITLSHSKQAASKAYSNTPTALAQRVEKDGQQTLYLQFIHAFAHAPIAPLLSIDNFVFALTATIASK